MSTANKIVNLTSGAVAEILPFKGRTVFEAQKRIADTGEDFMKVLISMTTKVDGKEVVVEDLDDMPGMDVIELLGEFSGANFRQSN